MAGQSRDNALDHVVVVVFENRSLDNVLGRLYGPGDGKSFDGVTGKDLTNPVPEWVEHGADRKVVPYTVATDMDSPNPDTGEEYPHTNTQLFNILPEENRFKLGTEISAPYNAPEPGQVPTMDGFVTDYISTLTAELGRQPTYEEYSQVMTGFTRNRSLCSAGWRAVSGCSIDGSARCRRRVRHRRSDRRDRVRVRGQRAGDELARRTTPPRRSSTGWTSTGKTLEGLRRRAGPVLRHRPDPLPPAQGPVRYPLRAVRPVRGRRRRGDLPTCSYIEQSWIRGTRGLPPRRLPRPGARHRAPRRRPAVVNPGR